MAWDPTQAGATAQSDNQGTARPANFAVASAARTATGQSAALPTGAAERVGVNVPVTAVSGTTPSMTLSLEWSHDGTVWSPGEPVDNFTAITAVGNRVKLFDVKAPYFRIVWTITGTTPSFTFAVHLYYQDN